MKSAIFLILVLIPATLFAQDVLPFVPEAMPVVGEAVKATGILDTFTTQPWFAIGAEISVMLSALTAAIPNRWTDKLGFWKYVIMILDLASVNIFANKNTRE